MKFCFANQEVQIVYSCTSYPTSDTCKSDSVHDATMNIRARSQDRIVPKHMLTTMMAFQLLFLVCARATEAARMKPQ